jgi:hypothetical protein
MKLETCWPQLKLSRKKNKNPILRIILGVRNYSRKAMSEPVNLLLERALVEAVQSCPQLQHVNKLFEQQCKIRPVSKPRVPGSESYCTVVAIQIASHLSKHSEIKSEDQRSLSSFDVAKLLRDQLVVNEVLGDVVEEISAEDNGYINFSVKKEEEKEEFEAPERTLLSSYGDDETINFSPEIESVRFCLD